MEVETVSHGSRSARGEKDGIEAIKAGGSRRLADRMIVAGLKGKRQGSGSEVGFELGWLKA